MNLVQYEDIIKRYNQIKPLIKGRDYSQETEDLLINLLERLEMLKDLRENRGETRLYAKLDAVYNSFKWLAENFKKRDEEKMDRRQREMDMNLRQLKMRLEVLANESSKR